MAKHRTTAAWWACILGIAVLTAPLYSQMWKDWTQKERPTFKEIQKSFYKHWKDKTIRHKGAWKQFKRWEWFARTRLDKNGYFEPTLNWKGWLEKKERFGSNTSRALASETPWTQLGPQTIPEIYTADARGGMGRLNCIAFHPDNPDIIWVGSPSGGLWKTGNGGTSWSNLTDHLPNLGVTSILIHPQNPNIMYIATGDGDGGDTFSIGVLKSLDGGISWNTTGLSQEVSQRFRIGKMLMYPSQPDTILVAASTGLYKTTDGGATWIQKESGYFRDIEVNETSPQTWYAAAHGTGVFASTDGGENWSRLTIGLPTPDGSFTRIAIALSESAPAVMYALYVNTNYGFYGFYRSSNGGASWTLKANSPNLLGWDVYGQDPEAGGQGSYDLTLGVDPANPDLIYLGGVNFWKSHDGGSTWQIRGHWAGEAGVPYVHADHHAFAFHPTDNTTIFSGNDGGLFKINTTDTGWTDLSSGLAIHQIYRIGQSEQDADKVVLGTQDNGSDLYEAGRWYSILGGDGMECAIDPTNNSILYASVYDGNFFRSDSNGRGWTFISQPFTDTGDWITPFLLDPQNPSTLYVATSIIFKSTDRGNSWNAISGSLTDEPMTSMAISPTNSNYIYAANETRMFRTVNGGSNWTELTGGNLPQNITRIAVHPQVPSMVWITVGGYEAGQKIFRSIDSGTTWQNMSGLLPNIPANCLVFDPQSSSLFVGTDLGVFYSPSADGNWFALDNGLPNVIITDLEVHGKAKKIRAATYGRGLWETSLPGVIAVYPPVNFSAERKRNRSLTQVEYLDILQWAANPQNQSEKVAKYRVYKMVGSEITQLAELNAATLTYTVRLVENDDALYYVSAIDTENKESSKVAVVVPEL